MSKQVKVTVFPRLNADSCGTGCGVSCSSCTGCDQNCGFSESEQEQMDDLYFILEEIGYSTCDNCNLEFVDTKDIDYSIERLNMVLVTSGEETVTHYTYGEYMTENAPIIALNSKILAKGKIPTKEELS
ncbi:hypothetical protein IH574_03755, partial [Candidatus Bathyarchaeota archaeon]|nr:hypothetical protein [Candidatus Bathyarchaeota archaeon]